MKARDDAFQLAAALGDLVGELSQDVAADLEGRIGLPLLLHALLQHLEAKLEIERADLGDEAALQARAHALVELVHLARRTGRGDDDLPAAVEQRIDDVVELLLGLGAVQELQIVDQQDVDRAELVLERQRVVSCAAPRRTGSGSARRSGRAPAPAARGAAPPMRWHAASASCRGRPRRG